MKLIILAIFVSLGLEANELLVPNIKKIHEAVKKTGTSPCATCDGQTAQTERTADLDSPHNRKTIKLSVLSPARAQEVFNLLRDDEDNSFNYTIEGCFARAHRMAQLMDEMGIISGKAIVDGKFYMVSKYGEYGWSFHMASVVLVPDKNNKLIPTVFDPALFNHPVSFEEWKKRLMKDPKSELYSDYFTSRFHYGPDTRHIDLSEYNEDELEEAKKTNRDNRRMGEMLTMFETAPKKGRK